jgi:hypothetical protein
MEQTAVPSARQRLLLVSFLVRNAQFPTAFCSAACQYSATVVRAGALTEAVLVAALTIRRLKSPFHCMILLRA